MDWTQLTSDTKYLRVCSERPTGVHFDLGEVPVEDLFASFDIGAGNGNLHVEPAGPHQGTEKITKPIETLNKNITPKQYI